jgi:GDP-L-fucose synthase
LPDTAFGAFLRFDPSAPQPPLVNIGWGEDYTIRELAEHVRATVGYLGGITWDTSKPDGTPRKLVDVSRMKALGWTPRVRLEEGLKSVYRDFLERYGKRSP